MATRDKSDGHIEACHLYWFPERCGQVIEIAPMKNRNYRPEVRQHEHGVSDLASPTDLERA